MSELVSFDEFAASLPRRFEKWKRVRLARRRVGRRRRSGDYPWEAVVGVGLMERDPCVYCGGVGAVYDHIEPLKRGGAHVLENVARACWRCNGEKNTQRLLVFLARRALKRRLETRVMATASSEL